MLVKDPTHEKASSWQGQYLATLPTVQIMVSTYNYRQNWNILNNFESKCYNKPSKEQSHDLFLQKHSSQIIKNGPQGN